MELSEKCTKCSAPFGKLDAQVCGRCGWDGQIGMRKCVKCRNAVILNEKVGYGKIGGVAGVGGFLFWYLLGPLLGGAIAAGAAGACGLVTALTLSYSCTDCGKEPESRLLDADEKEEFKKRRLGFLIGGAGLGALGLLLFVGWIALWRHRMSGA